MLTYFERNGVIRGQSPHIQHNIACSEKKRNFSMKIYAAHKKTELRPQLRVLDIHLLIGKTAMLTKSRLQLGRKTAMYASLSTSIHMPNATASTATQDKAMISFLFIRHLIFSGCLLHRHCKNRCPNAFSA